VVAQTTCTRLGYACVNLNFAKLISCPTENIGGVAHSKEVPKTFPLEVFAKMEPFLFMVVTLRTSSPMTLALVTAKLVELDEF